MMPARRIWATIDMYIQRNISAINNHLKHPDGFHKVGRKTNKSMKYWESSTDRRKGKDQFIPYLKMNLTLC